MELVKFFVELRYQEPHRIFRVYDELYSALTEKEPPKREPAVLPGFGLNITERKMRVIVDPQRSVVDLEYIPNPGYCVDAIIGAVRKINDLASLPSLTRIGARSYWMKPVQTEFNKLVFVCKEKLFKSDSFIRDSVDVGAAFVLTHKGRRVNISLGPMEDSQLKGLLFSRPSQLPKVLLFVDVDYSNSETLEYSERMVRDFVKEARDFAEEQSGKLEATLLEEHEW